MSVLAKWEGQDAVIALRAIRAAGVVRSKDETRRVLCGVLLTDGLVVATDSYCLIAVPLLYQGPDIVLPRKVVDRLEKIKMTGRMGYCSLQISVSEKTINVQWSDDATTEVSNVEMEVYPFPDWRRPSIFPEQYEISSSESVSFSIDMMSRIAKVASELGDRKALIKLQHVVNSKDATVWSIKAQGFDNVMWVQMPTRMRGDHG